MLQILVRELAGETDVVLLSATGKSEAGVKTWGRDWSHWPTLEEGPEAPPDEPGLYVWEGTIPDEPTEGEETLWRWTGAWREIVAGWTLAQNLLTERLPEWRAIYDSSRASMILIHNRGSWTEVCYKFLLDVTPEVADQIAGKLQTCPVGKVDIVLTRTTEGVEVQVVPINVSTFEIRQI